MDRLKSAYSMVMMSATKLIAVRDPEGVSANASAGGRRAPSSSPSETCALDSRGAKYLREVDPSEINGEVDRAGMRSIPHHCKGKGQYLRL